MLQIESLCRTIRRSLEPGFPMSADGKPSSAGTCLYASFLLHHTLEKFGDCSAIICGGDGNGDGGILGSDGKWYGHYWVEGTTAGGQRFIADITADQFGYAPVVVVSSQCERYSCGDAEVVRESVMDLAASFQNHSGTV